MIDDDVIIGPGTWIVNRDLVNLFGCRIGANCIIGPFVELTRNVIIGDNCTIESHAFICDSVTLEDNVFVSHGAMFVNDHYPRSKRDVPKRPTVVQAKASIGTNATILGGLTIGRYAIIGAGAVLVTSAPPYSIWVGNPARLVRQFMNEEEMETYISEKHNFAELL